jgi:uncharacterized metal-binding protein
MEQKKRTTPICDSCKNKKCRDGKDCFGMSAQTLDEYKGANLRLARAASFIEGRYYMKKTRLEELVLFCREMKYQKLGIAFCIGLSQEAEFLAEFLRREFEVVSVCCKVCGIEKSRLHLQKIEPGMPETMCKPIGQATLLNQSETDLNIICGLCMGHDIQFTSHSKAPVTTFIVKDRVLAHNTVASLYNPYLRKRIGLK